jgi:mannose/fructose-specific phosphotransferase system component IIA
VFNASYPLQKEKNVLIATGMNLSLVLTLLIGLSGGYTKESFAEAVNSSKEYTMVMPELAEDSTDDKEDFF